MTLYKLIACLVALVVSGGLSISGQSTSSDSSSKSNLKSGVVVEQVVKGWSGDKAGIKEGDILLRWSRGAMSGDIASPFDLDQIEMEQEPRGAVTLEGLGGKDNDKQTWVMGADSWKVAVRPQLVDPLLAIYREEATLQKTDNISAAVERLREAATEARTDSRSWLSSWFLLQAAKLSAAKQQWKEADAAYAEAIQQAEKSGPGIRAQLFYAWAEIYQQRNDWVNAEKYYRQSIAESQKSGDESLMIAMSLHNLGNLTKDRGDLVKAEEYYRQALEIRQKLAPESLAVAASFSAFGNVASDRGDLAKAQEYYQQALAIRQKLAPDSLAVASSLNNLGNMATMREDPPKALEYYQQSLAIRQRLAPVSLEVATSLNNLGAVSKNRGDLVKTEEYYQQALQIRQKLSPDSLAVAASFNNLGTVAYARGDLAKAERYFQQALAIKQKLAPGSVDIAASLVNLGTVAGGQGNMTRAERYYQQALGIQEKLAPGSLVVALILGNLGDVALSRGDLAQAEKYYRQAMEIQQKLAPGGLAVATNLITLGKVALERGDLETAQEYYRQAMDIQQKLAPGSLAVALSFNNFGNVANKRGDFAKAENYYRQALAIHQKLAPGSVEHADILASLAAIRRHNNDLTGAEYFYDQALTALEHQTSQLGGTLEVRTDFRAQHADYYREYGEVLLAEGKKESAFYAMERSRARALLEMFTERDILSDSELSPELLIARRQNASAYDTTQAKIADLSPAEEEDAKQITDLLKHLRELAEERDQIAERIKAASPRLAQLQYPQPLGVNATRQSLDPGTVLLEYSIGPEQSTLFVLRSTDVRHGFSVFRLPIGEKELRERVEILLRLIERRDEENAGILYAREKELYDILLRPAETLIQHSDRILLAPDGPLYLLPFAALRRGQSHDKDQYLMEWKPLHEIVSATVNAEIKTRRNSATATTEFVAFADPIYPSSENNEKEEAHKTAEGMEAMRGPLRSGFLPLPGSREEVAGISALFPGHSHLYIGADATEDRAKSVGENVRYLHFATHAFLNRRFPLDSALVLTIPQNPGESHENGFLQAWEISQQMRINTDLVTLSACESGSGQELGGEGLIGLTRSFLYAGTHSIVASRWSVADKSTAELMISFYSHLKGGENKDEALQHAQKELAHSSHYSQPFYWAAFYLTGDWR